MGRRKNEKLEFRFYELPGGSCVLPLLGEAWVGVYGQYDICQHFHNLFEIGYCHFGKGKLLLGEKSLPYEDAMISAIPANFPHSTVSDGVDSWEFLFFDPEELIREMVPGDLKKQEDPCGEKTQSRGLGIPVHRLGHDFYLQLLSDGLRADHLVQNRLEREYEMGGSVV